MARLCRCGQVVEDRCPRCDQKTGGTTTAERGYGSDWRKLSERYRAAYPLCQVCEWKERTRPATQVHHIVKVIEAQELRMEWSNLLGVCEECHGWIEDKPEIAREIKSHAGDSQSQRW